MAEPSDTAASRAVPGTALVTGCSGFIGRRLVDALLSRGFRVICAVRHGGPPARPGLGWLQADFNRDRRPEAWLPRLKDVDVVINAVGILRESRGQSFRTLHVEAPRALFAACAQAGVRRVVQVSALGADAGAASAYHLSKREADEFLLSLPLSAVVVQPSLVYGEGGASARLFTALASAPVIPLPGRGEQLIQPIHVDDVAEAVCNLTLNGVTGRLPLVGPQSMTFRDFLATLRRGLGLGRPRFVTVPMGLMRLAPSGLADRDTLAMLERGNTADAAPTRELLGHDARPARDFIVAPDPFAKLAWLLPVLRASVALVWLVTGVVSLGVYPVSESYALLARVGVSGALAPVMLYGAAALDVFFGVAILAMKRRRALWLAQIGVIVLYTAIITWKLPEFWLHPYGPVLKNLPMLAAIWLLYETEMRTTERLWTT